MDNMSPKFATFLASVNLFANVSVWMEAIKGWAAVFTVLLGVPTAILIMVYWALKVRAMWYNRSNQGSD